MLQFAGLEEYSEGASLSRSISSPASSTGEVALERRGEPNAVSVMPTSSVLEFMTSGRGISTTDDDLEREEIEMGDNLVEPRWLDISSTDPRRGRMRRRRLSLPGLLG